ncbi:MAG: pyruvate ferredoxin oxidoreductase [Candidatus Nezhaarchaeota archaeon]|nr:pyruvate ferredoxin oxidoreductase [Candidatus Nezhaarchaeota archaeon]
MRVAKRIAISGNHAISLAVKLADVDVIAAYPITPQTQVVEKLAEYVANGELDAEFISVESEHSAMSACIGAAAAGARVFTATCGPGLALMHEMVYVAAGSRLPIVMALANRSLSPNLNIWGDHTDIMGSRDAGWVLIFAEDVQEAFDLTLTAFKIAEDEEVMVPVAVNIDGFHLSHCIEALEPIDPDVAKRFLPPRKIPSYALHPKRPTTWGAVGIPEVQTEIKYQLEVALSKAKGVAKRVWREYAEITGRLYDVVDAYRMDGAEVAIVMIGSFCGNARDAVDLLRDRGVRAGLLKIRMYRPFPKEEVVEALKEVRAVAVVERAFSPGAISGPLTSDVKAALYGLPTRPSISGFAAGIGGREVAPGEVADAALRALKTAEGGLLDGGFTYLQVRW